MNTNNKISNYLDDLKDKLIKKNDDYGDSLHNPISVFHKGGKINGILARLDDKLNRVKSVGITDETEDTVEDLIGYLVHLKVMLNENKNNE